jgi:hypothetical protein
MAQAAGGWDRILTRTDSMPGGSHRRKLGHQSDGHAQGGFSGSIPEVRIMTGEHGDRCLKNVHRARLWRTQLEDSRHLRRNLAFARQAVTKPAKFVGRGQAFVEQQINNLLVAGGGEILDPITAVNQPTVLPIYLANAGIGDRHPPQPGIEGYLAIFFHDSSP